MNTMFGTPGYDAQGVKVLSTRDSDMLMDIKVYRLQKGDGRSFFAPDMETALLLMNGSVTFGWNDQSRQASRPGLFAGGAWCLHVPKGIKVTVTALENAEILVQQTENDRDFPPVFYSPENNDLVRARYTDWEGTAKRDIMTLFDYHNAPYSNLVLGEIYQYPGRWSSYPPHSHPQPEVYYYRYEKPQGFGACFVGDQVFKIQDGSYSAIPGGLTHPQSTAPGYPLYYVWMIRHLPGDPWTKRIDDPDHTWLFEQEDYRL